jgi:hypothetical protein
LRVEALRRKAEAGAPGRDRAEPLGGGGIKRLDELTERGEEVRRRREEALLPLAIREAFDAVANLGNRDRGDTQLVGPSLANPLPDPAVGLGDTTRAPR